jgi:hypothetical protein
MPVWVHDYYRPDSSLGSLTKSSCDRSVGPPNRLEIVRDKVIIGVTAIEMKDDVMVRFDLEVPDGNEVKFNNNLVLVSIPDKPEIFIATLTPFEIYGWVPWNLNQTLRGGTRIWKTLFGQVRTLHNEYSMAIRVSIPKTKIIKVKLPALLINGQEVVLPEMIFSKDKYVEFFMPINC